MVSLTIMATITGTYANGAHTFSYNKVANDRACHSFVRQYLVRAQWRVGNGWNGGDGGWAGWGAGTQFYGVTKYN